MSKVVILNMGSEKWHVSFDDAGEPEAVIRTVKMWDVNMGQLPNQGAAFNAVNKARKQLEKDET